jgi:hypothetical protein
MTVRQFLAVFRGDVHLSVRKAIFDSQLFPQALGRRTGSTTRRHE